MSNKLKEITSISTVGSQFSLENTIGLMNELEKRRFAMFEGLPVVEDISGLFCTPDSYVVVMGSRMFKKLKEKGERR